MTVKNYLYSAEEVKKKCANETKFNSKKSKFNMIKHWRDVNEDDVSLLEPDRHLMFNPLLLTPIRKNLTISKKVWSILVFLFCHFKPGQVRLLQDSIFRTTATVEKMLI